ncbi:hypothetical protein DFS34DRAFT_690337 [Phlyctochytrium arcticum]|nr:hypothetical protein DFS34DRAFT_690337 [Phlyctochytrium arcticum]
MAEENNNIEAIRDNENDNKVITRAKFIRLKSISSWCNTTIHFTYGNINRLEEYDDEDDIFQYSLILQGLVDTFQSISRFQYTDNMDRMMEMFNEACFTAEQLEKLVRSEFKIIQTIMDPEDVNSVSTESPLLTSLSKGEATISLNIDPDRLNINQDNLLTTIDPSYEVPLSYSENDSNNERSIALLIDEETLFLNQDNRLAAKKQDPPEVDSPLFYNDDDQIELRYASHFNDDEGLLDLDGSIFKKGLSLKIAEPFSFNSLNSHRLTLNIDDDTLYIDDGKLTARIPERMSFIEPLDEVDNVVRLNIDEDSLQIDDGKLKAKKQDATTLLKGAGAISVYKDPLESLDSALVKLEVDHNNFQQTGNKLSIRSTGMGEIPYDNGIAGLNRTSDFTYTETLNELNVGHINLSPNSNPSDYEATTAEYVKGVYQGTGPLVITNQVVELNTDATLAVDTNMNLSVNPSPLVDNSTIRIDSSGKIASGLLFQQANGLGINGNDVFLDIQTSGNLEYDSSVLTDTRTFSNGLHENSSHQVELDLSVSGGLQMNSTKTNIEEILTASSGVTRVGNDFRGGYSAGTNISISGSTISCTYQPEADQPYVGGNGISVVGKTISNTLSILPGTGIIVTGGPGGPYTISSINTLTQKKAEDSPTEETTEGSEGKILKNGGGDVVQATGGLAGILTGLSGLFTGAGIGAGGVAIGSSAIGSLGGGILGGGIGLAGGFATVFGKKREEERDENGTIVLNPDGTVKLQPGGQVVIATLPTDTCGETRLLFDIPTCSYLGIQNEYPQTAINLQMLREYDSEVIKPNTALLESIEGDLNNNYQTKISGTNKIPYSLVNLNPDLSIYLNRTTDLNTINASIGTKVAQSVYDIRQTAIDTSISTKQNTITTSMDYLEKKMERLIDLDQSQEFKKAQKLIKEHTDLLATIKKTMKLQNITSHQIKRGTILKKLKFKILTSRRVDVTTMPEEVRELYLTTNEVWVRNIDIIETSDTTADDVIESEVIQID